MSLVIEDRTCFSGFCPCLYYNAVLGHVKQDWLCQPCLACILLITFPIFLRRKFPAENGSVPHPDFLKTLEEGFKEFFEKEVPANPLKAEYLIPTFIGELLSEGKMSVKVLRTNDTWYGMTYKEDVAAVKESFSKMLEDGTYKGDLFSNL